MAQKLLIKTLLLCTCLSFAHPARARITNFAEQFTSHEAKARSERMPDQKDINQNLEVEKEIDKEDEENESFILKEVRIKGNKVYATEDLEFLYKDHINNLVDVDTVREIAKKISTFYRKNGYILSRAELPEQEVRDGDVDIEIHENGLSEVVFEGDIKAIQPHKEMVEASLKKSGPFQLKTLQTQINLLRTSSNVLVYPHITPLRGDHYETKLTLNIQALKPTNEQQLEDDSQKFELKEIHLKGNHALKDVDLAPFFKDKINTKISEKTLEEIVKKISKFYRAQGYVLSRAYLPAQDILDGGVDITIYEGHLKDVIFAGDTNNIPQEHLDDLRKKMEPEKAFHLKDLTRYVNLAQELGYYNVYPSLKPDENGHDADLTLTLQKMTPEEIRENHKPVPQALKFKLKEVKFSGNTVFDDDDLKDLFRDKFNKIITLHDVREMTQSITRYYRQDGYILSQAILPPQDVREGTIEIKVIEGFISEVIFEGDTYDLEEFLADTASAIKNSRPLHIKDLESHLLLLKDLPNLHVTSTMKPAKYQKHSSSLLVKLKKSFWKGNISINNYGTKNVGPIQGTAMLNFVSPIDSTHGITVSGSKTYDPKEMRLVQTSYTMPLGTKGTKLSVDGMISRSSPNSSEFGSNLKIKGEEDRLGFSISTPLLRGRYHNLYTNMGYTIRNVESTSSRGLSDSEDRIRKFNIGFVFDFSDALKGVNILRGEFVKGTPYFGASKQTQPTKTRDHGRPRFSLASFFFSRDQYLFGPLSLYAMIHGQAAFCLLLSSERFRGGGMPYNKAYPNSALTGDSGVEAKMELRFVQTMEQYLQHYMLYAYVSDMRTWNRHVDLEEKKREGARGMGIGARATFKKGTTFEIEYGRPLSSPVGNSKYKSKILMGFTQPLNNG